MVDGLYIRSEHGMDYDFDPLDGDYRNVSLLDNTPDDGTNPDGRAFVAGRPVDPTNVPTKVQWKDRNSPRDIPDFSQGPFTHVSARVKGLIEEFEPGVHQFLPVEFVDTKGDFIEKRWFLCVCNRLDTIDRDHQRGFVLQKFPAINKEFPDRSIWVPIQDLIRRKEFDLVPPDYDASQPAKLVFNLSQIGGAHLWCDKYLLSGGPFVSSEFIAALKSSGFTGIRLDDNGLEAV